MRVRIIVADQSEARFYDTQSVAGPLRPAGRMAHPQGRLHDRDLISDRPGRVFDHAAPAGSRRGAVAHHATGDDRSPHKHQALEFARQIAAELDRERQDGIFDRLVLMSGPAFLGLLRAALPKQMRAAIVAEIPKDLVHSPDADILEHVPRAAFDFAQAES